MKRRLFITLFGLIPFGIYGSTVKSNIKINSTQKFFRGHRVKIIFPQSFKNIGEEGIIISSCREEPDCAFILHSKQMYTLLLLRKIPVICSWFSEENLSLVNNDRDAGEQLYQNYLDKKYHDYINKI